jgi:uracil-DNA glycosylase
LESQNDHQDHHKPRREVKEGLNGVIVGVSRKAHFEVVIPVLYLQCRGREFNFGKTGGQTYIEKKLNQTATHTKITRPHHCPSTMSITPDDIAAMFAGLTDATKQLVARQLHAELAAAITKVNKEMDAALFPGHVRAVEAARERLAVLPQDEQNIAAVAAAEAALEQARAAGKSRTAILPPQERIFEAFRQCPVERIRVVLLGQDPYIKIGEAVGMSFSVGRGVTVPPSLRNIYDCLVHNKLMRAKPTHGDLTRWAQQGVLLLNTALTVRVGQSASHAECWKEYTDKLIAALSGLPQQIIFILLGNYAQGKKGLIDCKRHMVLEWGHPSPLNSANRGDNPKGFKYCTVFSRTNDILTSAGQLPINWDPNAAPTVDTLTADTLSALEAIDKPVAGDVASTTTSAAVASAAVTSTSTSAPAPPAADPATSWIRPKTPADPPTPEPGTLWVFTDGGSVGNGRAHCRSSWAFYISDGATVGKLMGTVEDVDIPGQVYKTSNQRGELTAIYFALKTVKAQIDSAEPRFIFRRVVLVSDSEYGINCVDVWYKNWAADESKMKGKKNIDIIAPAYNILCEIRKYHDVMFRHVNSHQSEPANRGSIEHFYWTCNGFVDEMCSRALGRGP